MPSQPATAALSRTDLPRLFDALTRRGYQIIGPTVRESAIVYDRLSSVDELPIGWTEEQEAGTYRLKRRHDQAVFGFVVGPQSWKKFLLPPVHRLWSAVSEPDGFRVIPEPPEAPRQALLGVRACEIAAIAVQDRVFLQGPAVDPVYAARREQLFIIAVNCTQAGGTCFCVSMKTGPKATTGFDLALTEILTTDQHYFVLEVGSPRGEELVRELALPAASAEDLAQAQRGSEQAAKQMGRQMDTTGMKELFYKNYEHPRWDDVASRCLACANCTMVCPTCFCTTVEDVSDLSGKQAERVRKWDSCFTADFSYLHGGSVRSSIRSRYRQWLTHKLATWIDQFGTSGCVGCGRCITWCPVGIDLTEEVKALRANSQEDTGHAGTTA